MVGTGQVGALAAYQAEFESAADRLETAQSLIENGSIPDAHSAVIFNLVAASVALERGDVTSALERIERERGALEILGHPRRPDRQESVPEPIRHLKDRSLHPLRKTAPVRTRTKSLIDT